MVVKADYHFHPNLPKDHKKAFKKAKKWWEVINKIGLNALIITEHSYKNAAFAYEIMKQTQPAGSNVFIFPGIEVLTKENIDLVVFSLNTEIYEFNELSKPFFMSFENLIKWLKQKKYYFFIPHLFTPGTTSALKLFKDTNNIIELISTIPGIEVHNTSQYQLKKLLNLPLLKNIFKKTLSRINKTIDLPQNFYLNPNNKPLVDFFAGGSDAHTFNSMGAFYKIQMSKPYNIQNVFEALVTNINGTFEYKSDNDFNILNMAEEGYIVLKEFLMKQFLRL